nr:RHS repeat domain-containing protein [Escherichia coli]
MVAHRHTSRPEIRYRYDSDGRVTEQLNPAGLSYTYQYEKDHITITDSLDRREVLHTQGGCPHRRGLFGVPRRSDVRPSGQSPARCKGPSR